MIELRVLGSDDWAMWRELRQAALAEAPYAFGSRLSDWQGEGDREQRWRARLEIPGSYNLVAMLGDRPAGMASGVPSEQSGVVELISMWVGPAGRGGGVGDCLVRAVAQWALGMRAEVLRLAVVAGNERAIALYRRNGFVETGELVGVTADGAGGELVMAKVLDVAGDRNSGMGDQAKR